jgi:hypothetical protein
VCSVFANQGALIIYNACSNRELGGLKSRKDIIRARMCYYGLVCGRGEIINIGATSCIGEILYESKKSAPLGQTAWRKCSLNLISVRAAA